MKVIRVILWIIRGWFIAIRKRLIIQNLIEDLIVSKTLILIVTICTLISRRPLHLQLIHLVLIPFPSWIIQPKPLQTILAGWMAVEFINNIIFNKQLMWILTCSKCLIILSKCKYNISLCKIRYPLWTFRTQFLNTAQEEAISTKHLNKKFIQHNNLRQLLNTPIKFLTLKIWIINSEKFSLYRMHNTNCSYDGSQNKVIMKACIKLIKKIRVYTYYLSINNFAYKFICLQI